MHTRWIFVFVLSLITFSNADSLPQGVMGFYCLLADDPVAGYNSLSNWQPSLYDYQMQGSNVLWFTFINPQTMEVPPAYQNLALCRNLPGCPSSSQK